VTYSWSNASAAAGHDPCVPNLPHPYVVAVPELTDQLKLDLGGSVGGQVQTAAIAVPVGSSRTIPVDLYSDGPTDDWTVTVRDLATHPTELVLSLDKTSGHSGDQLMLTIDHVGSGSYGASVFVIYSSTGGTTASVWWGLVGN
jgi:hypothetical protein